jgi:hypothetical protein
VGRAVTVPALCAFVACYGEVFTLSERTVTITFVFVGVICSSEMMLQCSVQWLSHQTRERYSTYGPRPHLDWYS